jgi:protein required for attachment to host cells
MARLDQGTWVLIADGEKALFLENLTDHENPNLRVRRHEHNDNPPTRLQGTDAPGRRPDVGPGQRSAMEEVDWHRIGKERFADRIAQMLYRSAQRGDFGEIVLVAPPKILGELRSVMHDAVSSRVIAELPKTLTNHGLADIERIVKDALAATE